MFFKRIIPILGILLVIAGCNQDIVGGQSTKNREVRAFDESNVGYAYNIHEENVKSICTCPEVTAMIKSKKSNGETELNEKDFNVIIDAAKQMPYYDSTLQMGILSMMDFTKNTLFNENNGQYSMKSFEQINDDLNTLIVSNDNINKMWQIELKARANFYVNTEKYSPEKAIVMFYEEISVIKYLNFNNNYEVSAAENYLGVAKNSLDIWEKYQTCWGTFNPTIPLLAWNTGRADAVGALTGTYVGGLIGGAVGTIVLPGGGTVAGGGVGMGSGGTLGCVLFSSVYKIAQLAKY